MCGWFGVRNRWWLQVDASDETALDCVKSVDEERIKLEREAVTLVDGDMGPGVEQRLEDIYARCAAGLCFRSVV